MIVSLIINTFLEPTLGNSEKGRQTSKPEKILDKDDLSSLDAAKIIK